MDFAKKFFIQELTKPTSKYFIAELPLEIINHIFSYISYAGVLAGENHIIYIKSNGLVYSQGINHLGQLGLKNQIAQNNPVNISQLKNTKIIGGACGLNICVLYNNLGDAFGFGNNSTGELHSNLNYVDYPIKLLIQEKIILASCEDHKINLINNHGELFRIINNKFEKIKLPKKIINIYSGGNRNFLIFEDFSIYYYGPVSDLYPSKNNFIDLIELPELYSQNIIQIAARELLFLNSRGILLFCKNNKIIRIRFCPDIFIIKFSCRSDIIYLVNNNHEIYYFDSYLLKNYCDKIIGLELLAPGTQKISHIISGNLFSIFWNSDGKIFGSGKIINFHSRFIEFKPPIFGYSHREPHEYFQINLEKNI